MIIIYSPDGTHHYGTRGGEFEGIKSCFYVGTSYSLVETFLLEDLSFSYNAQRHRQTDRQTTNSMMPIAMQYDKQGVWL